MEIEMPFISSAKSILAIDEKPQGFQCDYTWKIPSPRYQYEWMSSEFFTLPNYDKIFFSIYFKKLDNNNHKILLKKNGIFDPTEANVIIKLSSETKTQTIKNWKNQDVVKFNFNFSYAVVSITCEILMDRIDFDEIDEETLSSTSVHSVDDYLLSSLWSDVIIKIKDNTDQLPAHKLILASHSSVFETMLKTDMREAKENCICFDEFDIDTIKEVLKFMYTGKIEAENDSDVLVKVLACAQMYQIEKLKTYCEYNLIKSLSVINVIKILIETDNFDVPKLNEKALLYMTLNKNRISFADAVKELNNSKVLFNFFAQQTEMKTD
ncbi:uncharacterized protein LOC130667959 [Microplitis mediator]|uniref:uncharacterized protein LOC130667959 n=1 Tax=Microplitis mediator TaxID=375433 RepID=UPI0025575B34|nr:uncharacterized protein LOC130667959 [Microplitis mediator]